MTIDLNILTLCDYAQEYNGKVVISGALNTLLFKQFPATCQELALIARFSVDEPGEYNIEFGVIGKNNEKPIIVPQKLKMTKTKGLMNSYFNLIIKGTNVVIPSMGDYKVYFKIEDQEFSTNLNIVDANTTSELKKDLKISQSK